MFLSGKTVIDRLRDELEKIFKDIEIWQEDKQHKTFEETPSGIIVDQVGKTETAVRVFKDGRIGFAFLSGEETDFNAILNNIQLSLRYSSEDENNILPEPDLMQRSFGNIKDDVNKETALNIFHKMRQASEKMPHLKHIERLFLSDEKTKITFYNSKVGFFEQSVNKISLGAVIIATKENEDKIEWDFASDEVLTHLDGEKIIETAYERAVRVLNSSPTYTGSYPVLLESRSACEFLEVLAKSFLAENLYKKRSIISEALTFSEVIDIIEDPFSPRGGRSFYFDGEGIAAREKVLVKNGQIKHFLYDSLYGRKMGQKSSGNAIRTNISSPPKNGYSNIYINSNKTDLTNEVKSLSNIIAITSLIGMHLVNPVTGEISVGFEGYLLEKGEYKKALSNMLLTGNIKELFKNVVSTGEDFTFYGSMGSPSLLIKDMSVTGI